MAVVSFLIDGQIKGIQSDLFEVSTDVGGGDPWSQYTMAKFDTRALKEGMPRMIWGTRLGESVTWTAKKNGGIISIEMASASYKVCFIWNARKKELVMIR